MSQDDHEYYGGSSIEEDPHVYENGVLKNIFGIKNTQELSIYEGDIVDLRLMELDKNPIDGDFDLDHAKRIHRHIFQDVYPWAGETRAVDISKGDTLFLPLEQIPEKFMELTEYSKFSGLLGGSIDDEKEFSSASGIFLGKINHIHPFREGNGRTQRQILERIAAKHGFELNWAGTSPDAMKKACIAAQDDPSCRALGRIIFLAQKKLSFDLDSRTDFTKSVKMINSEKLPASDSIDEILSSGDKSNSRNFKKDEPEPGI